jgi:hypothetical protein
MSSGPIYLPEGPLNTVTLQVGFQHDFVCLGAGSKILTKTEK